MLRCRIDFVIFAILFDVFITYCEAHKLLSIFVVCYLLKAHSWQPGIKNPYRGVVVWPVPENIEITVTLFKVKQLRNL